MRNTAKRGGLRLNPKHLRIVVRDRCGLVLDSNLSAFIHTRVEHGLVAYPSGVMIEITAEHSPGYKQRKEEAGEYE